MKPELAPPSYLLHQCAAPGCRALAFAERCEAHATDDDRVRLAVMHDALLRAAEAEEAWLATLREALDAERKAGVRRADTPCTG
jgi:protein-disulfide isomerase